MSTQLASITLTAMPWEGPGSAFVEISSDIDTSVLILAAVPEASRRMIRLSAGGGRASINGLRLDLAAGVPAQVRGDVVLDRRDPAEPLVAGASVELGSRTEHANETTNLEYTPSPLGGDPTNKQTTSGREGVTRRQHSPTFALPFLYTVIDASAALAPCSIVLSSSGNPSVSGGGELGWIARPPLGYAVVTPRVSLAVSPTTDITGGSITAHGFGTDAFARWLEADLAYAGSSAWTFWQLAFPAMAKGASVPIDLRLRILGNSSDWKGVLSSADIAANLRLSNQVAIAAPPIPPAVSSQKTEGMVGPYKSFDECVDDQLKYGTLAEARATCRTFGKGSAKRA